MLLLSQARSLANSRELVHFLDPIPAQRRAEVAEATGYDYRARKIFFEPYFRALLILTLSKATALRDLHRCINEDLLFAVLGARMEAGLSSLSEANANRPVTPFLMLLDDVLGQLRKVPSRHRVLTQIKSQDLEQIRDLLDEVVLFDSTTLTLPAKIARWAKVSDDQAGVKLHLRLRNGVGGVDQVTLVPGRHHDSRHFQEHLDLTPGAGHIHLFDCGFRGIATYDETVESGNSFVTTKHGRLSVEIVEERPLPQPPGDSGYQVLRDCLVRIGKGERRSPHLYRLVEALDTRGEEANILTNLLEKPVDHICWLKRYHWMIEILMRWLKHSLNLDHLISYSPRGIIMQVAMTLIAWALMVLYHQQLKRGQFFSPTELLRDIRVELHRCLYRSGYVQGVRDALAFQRATTQQPPLALPPP